MCFIYQQQLKPITYENNHKIIKNNKTKAMAHQVAELYN